jgi:hypothetical protein
MKVYLPQDVRGDWPIGHHLVARAGYHEAVANPHGAVCVVLPSGELLGVKPGEFESHDEIRLSMTEPVGQEFKR